MNKTNKNRLEEIAFRGAQCDAVEAREMARQLLTTALTEDRPRLGMGVEQAWEFQNGRIRRLIELITEKDNRLAELESRTVTAAASDVLAERQRQISAEGWSPEHDDEHVEGQIADAAACYALFATDQRRPVPAYWPWSDNWWKQRGQRRDLVRAGALIIAEIERIDRAAGIQVIEGDA
ncbi:MAG: hypothetical protein EOM43_00235 [Gammaproteobacteria bacterium]|nr:hypothetical protein [Gammaproteobacteria bacterium]